MAAPELLELRELRFGSNKDGNVVISFLLASQKILISRECSRVRGIGIRSLRSLHLQSVGTSHAQAR